MVCQSYTDSLFLGHVAIDTIAVGVVGDVVGSDSPMLHIVHHWYNITQNTPLVKSYDTTFSKKSPEALGLPPLAVDPSRPTG